MLSNTEQCEKSSLTKIFHQNKWSVETSAVWLISYETIYFSQVSRYNSKQQRQSKKNYDNKGYAYVSICHSTSLNLFFFFF